MNIPIIASIGLWAFAHVGNAPLTIIMGATAPILEGAGILDGDYVPRSVTVEFPAGATGYGTIPFNNLDTTTVNWGNRLRERDVGSGFPPPPFTVHDNINLTLSPQ